MCTMSAGVHSTALGKVVLLLTVCLLPACNAEEVFLREWIRDPSQDRQIQLGIGPGPAASEGEEAKGPLNEEAEGQQDGRVVNGNDVTSAIPYQVRIDAGGALCGGSLVDAQWVLTAAHCCVRSGQSGSVSSFYTVTAGTTSRTSGGTTRSVAAVYVYDSYDNTNLALEMGYDVCLLQLASAYTLSDTINVIPISSSLPSDGTSVRVSGWGSTVAYAFGTSAGTSLPDTLQEAFVTVFGEATTDTQFTTYNQFLSCNGPADIAAAYNWNGIVAAGRTAEPVADACQGDSGGPLAVADSGSSVGYSLVGVVSHGFGCAQLYSPGFYAAVADKVTWIQAVIAGTSGVSLCNGINCGPNAECVSSSCSCKTGFSALTSNWRGEECLRWLSTSTTTVTGYSYYFELVDTATAWGSTSVRGWYSPSAAFRACGYAIAPSTTVASLVSSYISTYSSSLSAAAAPSDRVWTWLSVGTTSTWFQWSSISYENAAVSVTNWASGEPASGGSCASMSVNGTDGTSGQWYAESCSNTYWYVRAYASVVYPTDSPSPGVTIANAAAYRAPWWPLTVVLGLLVAGVSV